MEKADNKLSLQAFGTLVQVITRSSPAYVVIWFYVIFTATSVWTGYGMIWWMCSSLVLGVVLVLLLVFKPDRLWSEKQTLEMKKLDMKLLGDKQNPQVSSQEYIELYQPVEVTKAQKKK